MLINATVSAAGGNVAETFTGTSVSHTEATVTWNFNSTVTYGYYANGEPFVVADGNDIVITSISPAGFDFSGRQKNGTVVAPDTTVKGKSFDSELSSYNAADNVDPGKTGSNLTIAAATYPNGVSVVKGVSLPNSDRVSTSWMEYYSILTVVPSIPAMLEPFRPPVVGTDKTSYFKKADLLMSKFKSLAPVTGLPVASAYDFFVGANAVSWRSGGQSNFRDMQPSAMYYPYTNTHKKDLSRIMMIMHSNITTAAKEPLTIAMVQGGIDFCAGSDAGINYSSDSAHNDVYKCQAVLAAVMLDDAGLTTLASKAGAFDEDNELRTITVSETLDDYLYKNAANNTPGVGQTYQTNQIGWGEWWLSSDRPSPWINENYRMLYYEAGPTLAFTFEMLGAAQEGRTVWNNESCFDYAWRVYNWFQFDTTPGIGTQGPGVGLTFMDAHWTTYSASSAALLPEQPITITTVASGSELTCTAQTPGLMGTGTYVQTDLRYKTSLGGAWTEVLNFGNSATTSGLSANTYYYVQMRFVSSVGAGPWSMNHYTDFNGTIDDYPGFGVLFTDSGYGARLDEILALNPGDETIAEALINGIATTGA